MYVCFALAVAVHDEGDAVCSWLPGPVPDFV